ncbi:MAG TPA: hypothetical protein VGE15_13185 [Sphingobacteriaceae bacterium]
MKKIFLILSLALPAFVATAQDRIYKKDKEVIEAKISEIGTGDIRYRLYSDPEGPVYTLEKDRILKVVYQNGRTEQYQSSLTDPDLYTGQPTDALKINFLAPLLGYTQLNWEHNIRPGRSFETTLGIIGLGKRQESASMSIYDGSTNTSTTYYREAKGVFISGGYKFAKRPDYAVPGTRLTHVFQGFYAKPELSLGVYGHNELRRNFGNNTLNNDRKTTVFSGLILNLGKQWVLGDAFLLDIYAGLGYAVDNVNPDREESEDYYYESNLGNHFILNTSAGSGLGASGGIKLGFLLK